MILAGMSLNAVVYLFLMSTIPNDPTEKNPSRLEFLYADSWSDVVEKLR